MDQGITPPFSCIGRKLCLTAGFGCGVDLTWLICLLSERHHLCAGFCRRSRASLLMSIDPQSPPGLTSSIVIPCHVWSISYGRMTPPVSALEPSRVLCIRLVIIPGPLIEWLGLILIRAFQLCHCGGKSSIPAWSKASQLLMIVVYMDAENPVSAGQMIETAGRKTICN